MVKIEHKSQEMARLFYRELLKIHGNDAWSQTTKAASVGRLMELIFLEVTKSDNIQFTTLFARISYACHRAQVDKKTQYWIHFFRRKIRTHFEEGEASAIYATGLKAVAETLHGLYRTAPPADVAAILPDSIPYAYREIRIREFRKKARVSALKDDPVNECLLARDEANPADTVLVKYNIADRNEPFNPTIRQIRHTFGFPVTLSLIDVEIDEQGLYRPRAFVVEPDYLLDVSAVANCFQGNSAEPVVYLLQKFLPVTPGVPLIVGNIANFFLDELMHDPNASFKSTFPKVFKTRPLTFSLLPDTVIREIYHKSQRHWITLQMMVRKDLRKFDIDPEACYLEPSFYDETHGLQGRLDVFQLDEKKSAIIELKSGKPYMQNRYGIGASHYIQTLLYDLMVRSVFPGSVEPASYILYSGLESNQLRYAPPVKSEQNEALQIRNQLVAIDRLLADIRENVDRIPLLQRINTGRFPNLKGYLRQHIALFEKTYGALNELERRYFNAFTGFIAREHRLAKTGMQGVDNANGLASLWLDTFEEKEANFQLVRSLRIRENRVQEDDAIIVFDKTETTSQLANFRPGDIAVLYPVKSLKDTENGPVPISGSGSPVTTQIFKVSILEITPATVSVRLRYKQFNQAIFGEYDWWNLEHDQMDMSFNAMYQGLFRWAQSPESKRQLLLTTRPPHRPQSGDGMTNGVSFEADGLTDEQQHILEKMLSTKEYFLLWGPPGTGKTSKMLKAYARKIFLHTDENLLLLGYTNRAVDEICEALESLGPEVAGSYIRIGSRYSTGERFTRRLLGEKTGHISNRESLKEILGRHRIYVSTLASLSNNLELLQLKKFRRVVIDEASQILEPMLAGLLPQFEQFILIGDHKQLPAVVVQQPGASAVLDEQLCEIGLGNLRNSLFERLYKRCCEKGWHWAYDHLSHQGRMHREIMLFPGNYFYEGKLKILPEHIPFSQHQTRINRYSQPDPQFEWAFQLVQQRIAFCPTPVDWETPSRKTNRHEAERIAELVLFFQAQELVSAPLSIGVITPYRAQIAQIQEVLLQKNVSCPNITIDTVERYQGGARDIILISLCTNAASQMEALVSLSEEGVDRKLNVALTRAREQVVILGNESILRLNETYTQLLEYCRKPVGRPGTVPQE